MANIGYFDNAKKEYVITNMRPRRPLSNYLWNELFLLNIDNFGFGESFLRISPEERRVLFGGGEASLVLSNPENEKIIASVREKVNSIMVEYPMFAY